MKKRRARQKRVMPPLRPPPGPPSIRRIFEQLMAEDPKVRAAILRFRAEQATGRRPGRAPSERPEDA